MREARHDLSRFVDLRLGDILTLPDGRSFSVRMFAPLPENALGLESLIVLGDLEMLLAPDRSGLVHVLMPAESLPPGASTAKRLCDGASAFWAPHLPAVGGAMGEILFRVLLLRNVFAPLVVLDRSGEYVFFLRVGELDVSALRATRMPVSTLSTTPVVRFAAVVDPVPMKVLDPAEEKPLPRPSRVRR
jgi:hypothetical protein